MSPVTVTISVHDETTTERMTRSYTFESLDYSVIKALVNVNAVQPIERLYSEVET